MRAILDEIDGRLHACSTGESRAGLAVHALLTLMHAGVSYKVMRRAMHIHPTVSELQPTVLGELRALDTAG